MKKDSFLVLGMSVMVLALGFVFVGCVTNSGGERHDGDDPIGGMVWKREHFYSTEAQPWKSRLDSSLTLVFTETQLKFRYDSNNDGDFDDAGEYTYTYTITAFGGNDWSKEGNNEVGDYYRKVSFNNVTKTGQGTSDDLASITEFWVGPNLGDNGKIDGQISISGKDGEGDLGFFGKN
jgi:hypothetical protein